MKDLEGADGIEKIEKDDWVFLNSNHLPYRGPRIFEESAQYLINRGIRGFGKSRSIGYEQIVHKLFHQHDVLVLDSLDQDALSSITGKRLWTVAFPLAIKYLDTSPCRVVAFEEG